MGMLGKSKSARFDEPKSKGCGIRPADTQEDLD